MAIAAPRINRKRAPCLRLEVGPHGRSHKLRVLPLRLMEDHGGDLPGIISITANLDPKGGGYVDVRFHISVIEFASAEPEKPDGD